MHSIFSFIQMERCQLCLEKQSDEFSLACLSWILSHCLRIYHLSSEILRSSFRAVISEMNIILKRSKQLLFVLSAELGQVRSRESMRARSQVKPHR